MVPFRNAAIAFAAASVALVPVAASAAPALNGVPAVSATGAQSRLEGNSSWLIGLVGLLAGIAAIIVIVSDDDDAPVSP